jgi:hypothetical protein
MTTQTIAIAPVKRSVRVKTSQARAFEIFTAGYDRWWPRTHHVGASPMKQGIIEQAKGGRWYHICEDGSQCDVGQVLVWDKPNRVVLSWQLRVDYTPEPDPSRASEIEVRFTRVSDDETLVELEHGKFERMGDAPGQTMATGVGNPAGGWGSILDVFAKVAAQSQL